MPRVIGIDPGTVTIDVCGLDDGRLFLDLSLPTAEALEDPAAFVANLATAGAIDLIAGPSGYGLPCIEARNLTDADLRLAFLARVGEPGGISGLRSLTRALGASALPVVLTPGVIHLNSVPAFRKINRIDMGTADKLCAVALAVTDHATRRNRALHEASFILLELGGAFSAVVAVQHGRVVDGLGGSSGPMGFRAPGALDGEVAYLAGRVPKSMVFIGGASAASGASDLTELTNSSSARARLTLEAYLESALKAIASLRVSAPEAAEVILSGRAGQNQTVRDELARRLRQMSGLSLHVLTGFASAASQAAQGAALIADGLAGGAHVDLVEALGIRDCGGTVLDHLHVLSRAEAEARLGIG
jgi:predicted butyrate kinase (DUF1464 family)